MEMDETASPIDLDAHEDADGEGDGEDHEAKEPEVTLSQTEQRVPRSPDFAHLLCRHGNVNPCPTMAIRVVSESAWKNLQQAFGVVALPHTLCCPVCVQEEVEKTRTRSNHAALKQTLQEALRQSDPKRLEYDKTGYYVGRHWAAAWGKAKPTKADKELLKATSPLADVLCPHNNLSPMGARRRLVPDPVWDVIARECRVATGIPHDAVPCGACLSDTNAQNAELLRTRNEKIAERKTLRPLYDFKPEDIVTFFREHSREQVLSHNKKRAATHAQMLIRWQNECKSLQKKGPTKSRALRSSDPTAPGDMEVDEDTPRGVPSSPTDGRPRPDLPPAPLLEPFAVERYLVPSAWVARWRRWADSITDPHEPKPDDCSTASLLCTDHELFIYTPEEYRPAIGRAQRRAQRDAVALPFCLVDKPLWEVLSASYNAGPPVKFTLDGEDLVSVPASCTACAEARRAAELRAEREFVDREITFEGTAPQGRRGSTKPIGGKIQCSHFTTVAELRMRVYNQTQDRVPDPAHLHLFIGDTELEEEEHPLSAYGIVPGTILILTVAARSDDTEMGGMLPAAAARREGAEVGFANSALASFDPAAVRPAGHSDAHWECPSCTFANGPTARRCDMCDTLRP